MPDRRLRMREAMRVAILEGSTALAEERLRRAFDGEGGPGATGPYVATVRESAYRVTDEHVEALRREGLTDAQIFELTVATAIGQAGRQHESAMVALAKALSSRKVG